MLGDSVRLGSIQPDAVRGVIMSEPRSCWSGAAQALTREALAAGADGTGLCLKHSAGRFGVLVDARRTADCGFSIGGMGRATRSWTRRR